MIRAHKGVIAIRSFACIFLWLFLGSNQYLAGRVYVCIMFLEHPKAQPKVVLEKPEIEPATPGLQGIELIHYTTTAPLRVWLAAQFLIRYGMISAQTQCAQTLDVLVYFLLI